MAMVGKEILEKVSMIHDLCLKINNRDDLEDGKPVVHYENCGGINAVIIKIFEKWSEDNLRPDKRITIYTDVSNAEHTLDGMIKKLEEMLHINFENEQVKELGEEDE